MRKGVKEERKGNNFFFSPHVWHVWWIDQTTTRAVHVRSRPVSLVYVWLSDLPRLCVHILLYISPHTTICDENSTLYVPSPCRVWNKEILRREFVEMDMNLLKKSGPVPGVTIVSPKNVFKDLDRIRFLRNCLSDRHVPESNDRHFPSRPVICTVTISPTVPASDPPSQNR